MNRALKWSLLAAAVTAAVGCGVDESSSVAPDTKTVFITSVRPGVDGKPEVTVKEITVAEQEAMTARRLRGVGAETGNRSEPQGTVGQDPYCAVTSMWLYDGPHQTGNMLCLLPSNGSDLALLNNFIRYQYYPCDWCALVTVTWKAAVRSYWTPVPTAGRLPGGGCLERPSMACMTHWRADDTRHEADTCVSNADTFWNY
jgi:hypothetical protein